MARGFCTKCLVSLTEENSYEQVFTRRSGQCKKCSGARKKQLLKEMTFERHEDFKAKKRVYGKTLKGRHTDIRGTLKKEGISSEDPLWSFNYYSEIMRDGICHYCGGVLNPSKIGIDRMNNAEGHVCYNVVPCCWRCNQLKADDISYEEMMMLAPILQEIRKRREASIKRLT